MADAAGIAAITGGTNVLIAGLAYLGSRVQAKTARETNDRQAQVAVDTAKQQTDVERAKVEAENSRLREQHTESDRQERKKVYLDWLAAVLRWDELMSGGALLTEETYAAWLDDFDRAVAAVGLFGSVPVISATDEYFGRIIEGATLAMRESEPFGRTAMDAFEAELREQSGALWTIVVDSMRVDLGYIGVVDSSQDQPLG